MNFTVTRQNNAQLRTCAAKASSVKASAMSTLSSVDGRITARRGMNARIHTVSRKLSDLERQFEELNRFVEFSMENYQNAETRLVRKSGDGKALYAKRSASLGLLSNLDIFEGIGAGGRLSANEYQERVFKFISEHWRTAVGLLGAAWAISGAMGKSASKDDDISSKFSKSLNSSIGFLSGKWNDAQALGGAAWNSAAGQIDGMRKSAESNIKSAADSISQKWDNTVDSAVAKWDNTVDQAKQKRDVMIAGFNFVKENKRDIFNHTIESAFYKSMEIAPGGDKALRAFEYLHYDHRDAMNGPHPSYKEVLKERSEWTQLPEDMSVYHDNGVGKPELKFIHPDGREAVFDGDTFEPVTDAKYKGTYNYINTSLPPGEFPKDLDGVMDWIEFSKNGLGHVVTDVIPYHLVGEKNEKDQERFE
ncbi:hypothetical protein LC085_17060 [Bacillus tianshenii]|uniref:hypothetical protein n=1 Tax=Sutcliffiella tianshenii TaxID=1463404 RepID=UPI001CD1A9E2|nr:hypothetical protein [Bacillus tianshenii]MCA1321618.1 hypothetical protein [Bacillus tianshenii]